MTAVLNRKALNRALLARQLLLERTRLPALDVIEHLVGMQSQAPVPPYIGLWTRIHDFRPDELSQLLLERKTVRIALMRSTIHLVSARDCLQLRPIVQPVINRSYAGAYGRVHAGIDLQEVQRLTRSYVEDTPATFEQIAQKLRKRWPEHQGPGLGYAARTVVPLVQIPPRGIWGRTGAAVHTTVEQWLGRPVADNPSVHKMLRRYLRAFGPASIRDMSKWCGLTRLKEVIAEMRPELVSFRDERGVELLDLPDAPRPDENVKVPVRLLPEWDNALLSHADRSRIIDEAYLRYIMTPNGIVPGSVLIDGFVRGIWKVKREGAEAVLDIDLFEHISAAQREELMQEGASLLRFYN